MTEKKTNLTFVSVITAINVLVATGFSVAGVVAPSSLVPTSAAIADSTIIFAMYAAARTIPLAILSIWAIIKHTRQELFILGVLAGAMQFLDGFIGIYQHDMGKTAGPFFLAALQFVALAILSKKEKAE
ncbi:MAG TPA: hypothetical protein VK787_07685 [Puia sp.]|jgi:hypothetical protein|nr:hypothetical protein [Puia sp.]